MRTTLSKSQIWDLNIQLKEKYGLDLLDKKDIVQVADNMILLVNGEPHFFLHEKQWVPTVKLMLKNSFLKEVVVDMGAIKFVIGGADIMRPGITLHAADIKQNDIVVIKDVTNKKPLAVGQALFNAAEIDSYSKGRVIKNLHWVGDHIWKFEN